MPNHVQRSLERAATGAARRLERIGDEYDAIADQEAALIGGMTPLERTACLAQATARVLRGSRSPSRHSQSPSPHASSRRPSNSSGTRRGEDSSFNPLDRAGESVSKGRPSSGTYLTVSLDPVPSPGGQRMPLGHARTPSGDRPSAGQPGQTRGRSPTERGVSDSLAVSYTSSRDRRAEERAFQPRTPSASPPRYKDAGKPPKPYTRVDTGSTDGNPNNSPPRTKDRIIESRNGSPERPNK